MRHNVLLPYHLSSAVVSYNWMKPAKQSDLGKSMPIQEIKTVWQSGSLAVSSLGTRPSKNCLWTQNEHFEQIIITQNSIDCDQVISKIMSITDITNE